MGFFGVGVRGLLGVRVWGLEVAYLGVRVWGFRELDLGGLWVLIFVVGARESLQLSVLVFKVPSGLGLG